MATGKPLLKEKDKPKKEKKHTVTWWKDKLWTIFTKYIKARDNYTCVTCGKYDTGAGMGGGHYIAKAACGLDYYFSEINVNAQCSNCNLRLEGNRPAYRAFIIKKYGEATLKDLEMNYHKPCVNYLFQEKIDYYSQKLDELKFNDKGYALHL